ncbi:sensor histidine kinase [Parafrankia elaeagni]|uniref:sensor histidine kinase n=1 Tax=Parafrankia elaeagni TaxID=222534 RepID=UPI0003786771|nr:HAMP domain-containing sensor histidine kinase [Parafrankia elaeagni]
MTASAAVGGVRRRRWPRPTIGLRLTLLITAPAVVITGALLLLGYLLVRDFFYTPLDSTDRTRLLAAAGTERRDRATNRRFRDNYGMSVSDFLDGIRREIGDELLRALLTRSAVVLVVTAVVAGVCAWVVARRALRPMREVTAAATTLSEGDLRARIPTPGVDDEVRDLVRAFNGMLARLEAAFAAQRAFAALVSHELRTPLASLRGEADLMLAQPDCSERERLVAGAAVAAVERSEALVSSLLALARAESGQFDARPVDLADVVGEVVGEHAEAAGRAGIRLDLRLTEARLPVHGERALLTAMVTNLVGNAVRHNRPRGTVVVAVDRAGPEATLEITNTGAPLSDEDVAALLRPFSRLTGDPGPADCRPAGHGLGTAVVAAVVAAHAGTFTARPARPDGLHVQVRLPTGGTEPAP